MSSSIQVRAEHTASRLFDKMDLSALSAELRREGGDLQRQRDDFIPKRTLEFDDHLHGGQLALASEIQRLVGVSEVMRGVCVRGPNPFSSKIEFCLDVLQKDFH